MSLITLERMKAFAPKARADIAQGIVAGAADIEAAGINTPLRLQHFLAQLAHESDQFKTTREYASGAAYEGRRDLGNTRKGDGRKFRGRGLIQITGRANAKAAGLALGEPYETQPELMEKFPHALLVSIWFWEKHGLNAKADRDDVNGITRTINGGTNGLADRKAWLAKAKKVFTAGTPARGFAALPGDAGEPTVDAAVIQKRLRDLGYTFTGGVDGEPGDLTRAGVMSFKDINGLTPITAEPDDEFVRVLMSTDAKPFPVPDGRENLTVSDLREQGSKTIERTDRVKNVGIWGTVVAGAGAVLNAVGDYFQQAREYLRPLMEFFGNVPLWAWGILGVAVCFYLYRQADKVQKGRVEAQKELRAFSEPDA